MQSGRNSYSRRKPEDTVLYQVLQQHLDSYIAEHEADGRFLPAFVKGTLSAYLDCGILSRGFLRARCGGCGFEAPVALSCKRRGVCTSCGASRMNQAAAHLVDFVFPEVAVRQWVLSVPLKLRYLMAYDQSLCKEVLKVFVRTVFEWLRRKSKRQYRLGTTMGLQCGAIAFIQRADSSLALNVHFHVMY